MLGSLFTRVILAILGFALSAQFASAEKFFIEQKRRLYPVIGADGYHPIVEFKGKQRTMKNGVILTKPGAKSESSGASLEIKGLKIVARNNPSSKLMIEFTGKADKRIDSGYLIVRTFEQIESNIQSVILQLPSFDEGVSRKWETTIPMSMNWEVRPLSVAAFSNGKQIEIVHAPTLKGRERHGNAYSRAGTARVDLRPYSRMPSVRFAVETAPPPEGLLDDAEQAYVVVEFYIDKDGVVREASSSDFTHQELVELAIRSLKESKFSPAYKEGEPRRVKTRQKFWFKRPSGS